MNNTARLLFTGDVCFRNQPNLTAKEAEGVLAEVMLIFKAADLRIMNLETPLAEEGVGEPIYKSGPNLIGRPQNLGFLTAAGCDCATLANNHTKDYGEEALYATFDLLDKAGIARCGAGRSIEEAYKAWRVTVNGIKISLLSICENEFGIADVNLSGTAGFDLERLGDKLIEEKAVSDFVIVMFHGGCEQNPLPSPLCVERYRTIIRLGADALVGGHTHCMQGWEMYNGKPIIYSMGNFFFHWSKPNGDPWCRGYMTQLTLCGECGKITVELIPYRQDLGANVIRLLDGQTLTDTMAYIDRLSAIIQDRGELIRLYKGWCMISGLGYAERLVSKPEYFDPAGQPPAIAPLKNLLSCEAHNELMRTLLNLTFAGELNDALVWADEVRELQKMP
ncbi:MAG: CapA family protein [Clostridia bacterium]|nr:CapA family protein [Clostridia bacterium]